ncbi:hypothetical protein GLW08_12050 [Pontibacillus yanchengensis]|uniref:Uncharacterized protein n=2 Tax=Pontibacillus yanchengensis TaxID=462910 RepID=A0A6I5A0P4_9BACI|nr:hypothetical protein [Pontibacillus yanchengensis]MYL34020.1 hypothetical protein [Pontibacillus yanchengensis]MYL54070.1 hypothetical protein [Pontibacillus yanchengensis]
MTQMEEVLRQDGKRQIQSACFTLAVVLLIMVLQLLLDTGFWYGILFAIPFGLFGITLLSRGMRDIRFAGLAATTDNQVDYQVVSKRMYLGIAMGWDDPARLYDMDGQIHSEIVEKKSFVWKCVLVLAAVFSSLPIAPRSYIFYNQSKEPTYLLEKKGGLRSRFFIRDLQGNYLYYAEQQKQTSHDRIIHFYEKDNVRWTAESDRYLEVLTIKDSEGMEVMTLKKDAIPVEAADRFGSMSGLLIEKRDHEPLPDDLHLFLYVINIKLTAL